MGVDATARCISPEERERAMPQSRGENAARLGRGGLGELLLGFWCWIGWRAAKQLQGDVHTRWRVHALES